jgi:quercetin dioxygenase-like cupin family protein
VLKTILEYAEERGLSTGVVSNMNIADATPAACYAHANARSKFGEIFLQVFHPRYGDGVDVVLGHGRARVTDAIRALGQDLDAVAATKARPVYSSLADIPTSETRAIAVLESGLDVPTAAHMALDRLSRNQKGYFLMIEWDAHTDDPKEGLDNLVAFDRLIRQIASRVDPKDTLLLFTADHSFDFSVHGGLRGEPLLKGLEEWRTATNGTSPAFIELPSIRVHDDHTAEEVIVAATGPGADRVSGFMPNTRLFEIMLAAWGWQEDAATGAPGLQAPGSRAGSRIEREAAIAVKQPGPHEGGGTTTAFPFFADVEDLPLVFRKRALHPGSSIGAHVQEDDEIYYVISGTGEYTLDGRTSTVSAGSALLTRRGSTHSLRQTGRDDLVILITYLKKP